MSELGYSDLYFDVIFATPCIFCAISTIVRLSILKVSQ